MVGPEYAGTIDDPKMFQEFWDDSDLEEFAITELYYKEFEIQAIKFVKGFLEKDRDFSYVLSVDATNSGGKNG